MEFKDVKYLDAVIRHMSFTKAAEELYISQPSLSNWLSKFEEKIGFKIIERSTKKIQLSEMGEVFYEQCKSILIHYNNSIKEIQNIKATGSGQINIGMMESSRFWIPKAIEIFSKQYPEIQINFVNIINPKEIEDHLLNYKIHFVITVIQNMNPLIKSIKLFKDEFVLLVNKEHVYTDNERITLSNLVNENFIQYPDQFQIQKKFMEACLTQGFQPKGSYYVDDLELACSLVENNLGVTVIPLSYFLYRKSTMANLKIIRLNLPPNRDVYLQTVNERHFPKSVQDLLKIFQSIHSKSENTVLNINNKQES